MPRQLHEIATVIGMTAVIDLARHFGGQEIYLPRHNAPDSIIVSLIGQKAADQLGEYFFETKIDFPITLKREIIITEMLAQRPRPTMNEIIAKVGLSKRGLYKFIKRMEEGRGTSLRGPTRQLDLFAPSREHVPDKEPPQLR